MPCSNFARPPASTEKETNLEQRLAIRAQNAIKSASMNGAQKSQGNSHAAHAVIGISAMNFECITA
jgi:hypothetical protein